MLDQHLQKCKGQLSNIFKWFNYVKITEKKRLLWFSGEYGCFIQAEKEKYKRMCEKDLTSAGRKGKMLNVSLDHSNSVCISVNVKYTGPQTPRFFKNQLPAVPHKPKLLAPELYPHKHWWKSADPCHLAAQRSAAKQTRGIESFLEGSVRNLNEVRNYKTKRLYSNKNHWTYQAVFLRAPNRSERKVSSPRYQKRQGNERTRFGLLQPWGQIPRLMALKVNWKTPSHSGIGIYFAFEFFFVNSYRFNEVPWEKFPIWSCLEMSTAQSTLLAHYSYQDQFASLFLGLKVFERISFAPEQCGVEHLCTIYIIYRYSIKIWWERGRDCKCTDFIPGATGVRRSRRQWHRRKLLCRDKQRWNQGASHLRCRARPHQSQAQAREPSELGDKTHRTNLFSPALQRG